MMQRLMVTLVFLLLTQSVQAVETQAAAIQKTVFSGTTGFSEKAQQGVAEQLLQKQWQADEKGRLVGAKCGFVPHKSQILDLNADGVKELILMLGNECSSGKIGQTIYLFSQSADGQVQRQLGFSASGFNVLKAKEAGAWPDLLFLGTGDCQPVWRHQMSSNRYQFNHLYEAKPQACAVGQMQLHDKK